jgi:chromosomal replication initiator protein
MSIVSTQLGYSSSDLSGPARNRPLVRARQLAMYLIRELTDYSYPAIARHFGDRDHTTVIHAVEKITKDMNSDRELYDQVMILTKMIKEYS